MSDERSKRVSYVVNPTLQEDEMQSLFASAWEGYAPRSFAPVLARSLAYVCAYADEKLVGFVNLAWDGGVHGFLLDTTVHPQYQRLGIGTGLVSQAIATARIHGMAWVHVDYEPHLKAFYEACGFVPTNAGLLRL